MNVSTPRPVSHDREDDYVPLCLEVYSYRMKYNRDDGIKIIEIVRVGHSKDIYR